MDFLIFIIGVLAVYRLTRLAIADKVFDAPRSRWNHFLLSRDRFGRAARWLHDLINCGWCLSIWVAGAVTAAIDQFYSIPLPGFYALALAAGAVGYWNRAEPG